MIRGVSRYAVEVNKTGSPYFERAICFVRPEFAQCDKVDLHRAAQQLVASLDGGVEPSGEAREEPECGAVMRFLSNVPEWARLSVSAVLGAILAVILCAVVM